MSCGRMYFGAGRPKGSKNKGPMAPRRNYGMTLARWQALCKANGNVFDKELGRCRPPKPRGGARRKAALPAVVVPVPVMLTKAGKPVKYGPHLRRGPAPGSKKRDYKALPGGKTLKQRKAECAANLIETVLDMKTLECRAPKPKGRSKASFGFKKGEYKYGIHSVKEWKEACKATGLVYENGACRPPKVKGRAKGSKNKAPRRSYGEMTLKRHMALCAANGTVFDRELMRCREKKKGGRPKKVVAFGTMLPTYAHRPGITYYNASEFNTPSLLLGESFKAVANRAALQDGAMPKPAEVKKVVADVAAKAATEAAKDVVDAAFGRRSYRRRY